MDMTSEDLTSFISEVRITTPYVGESLVSGRLRSLGYRVSRERVRQALRSTDPLSSALRWPGAGPNSLWHIGKLFEIIKYQPTFIEYLQ